MLLQPSRSTIQFAMRAVDRCSLLLVRVRCYRCVAAATLFSLLFLFFVVVHAITDVFHEREGRAEIIIWETNDPDRDRNHDWTLLAGSAFPCGTKDFWGGGFPPPGWSIL